MHWGYYSVASPVVALAVNAVAQVLFVRARKGVDFFRTVLEGFFAGGIALAVMEVLLARSHGAPADAWIISVFVNAPAYAALSYCYFGLVNLGNTSIRIRLYAEIAERKDGMTMEDIGLIYNEQAFTKMRIERRVESGDLVEKDGRYYAARMKLVYSARILGVVRYLIIGKASEFSREQ